jgi:tetratricopeptide (TPR) repeat protein
MDDHLKQLILLGREHYTKREFDRAEYLLRQVVAETDRHADVFEMLGVIAHGRGDFVEAERHFEHAVSLNPNYTEAQLNLMVTYNDLGKYEKARDVYAQIRHRGSNGAARNDPFARGKIANMHAETAQAYLDLGMTQEAIRELERSITLCPSFVDLRTRLAVLYRESGSVDLAKRQLELALQQNPNFVPARQTLAVILLTHGDHDGAILELERAIASDPENRSAQMYLRLARSQRERSEPPPT